MNTVVNRKHKSAFQKKEVNGRYILSLYSCLIIIALVFSFDVLFFGQALRKASPVMIEFTAWFNAFFNFPHIICSLLLFSSRENVKFSRDKLARFGIASGVFLLIFLSLNHLDDMYFNVAIEVVTLTALLWTIKHVVNQQFSIGLVFLKKKETWQYSLWRWSGLALSCLVFLGIYAKVYTSYFHYLYDVFEFLTEHCLAVLVMYLGLSILAYRSVVDEGARLGLSMILWNSFMVARSYGLYAKSYFILAILGPRIVHDLTAIHFYSTYIANRSASKNSIPEKKQSMFHVLYRPVTRYILFSMAGGALFMWSFENYDLMDIYHGMAALHFYIESFFWKRSSPSRVHIPMKKFN